VSMRVLLQTSRVLLSKCVQADGGSSSRFSVLTKKTDPLLYSVPPLAALCPPPALYIYLLHVDVPNVVPLYLVPCTSAHPRADSASTIVHDSLYA
jgi:hypothetical protein